MRWYEFLRRAGKSVHGSRLFIATVWVCTDNGRRSEEKGDVASDSVAHLVHEIQHDGNRAYGRVFGEQQVQELAAGLQD